MKLKVYNPTALKPKEYFLKLNEDSFGITLAVVDQDGNPVHHGNILDIHNSTGTISLCHNFDSAVAKALGFELDVLGRVKVALS